MKKIIFLFQVFANLAVFSVILLPSLAQAVLPDQINPNQPIPGSNPVTMLEMKNIIASISNFLVIIAPIIFIIALVLSGITYMTAGASENLVKKAKDWLKFSIIGGLVVFGVGVIINTVAAIVSRQFFCDASFLGMCFSVGIY